MKKIQQRRVLIVDDDDAHRMMLKASLSVDGYLIEEAIDGDEAIRKVEKVFYDMILLDLKMKNIHGIQALQQIKQISPAIPVLIMTAYASIQTAVEGLKLGAFDYLIKPLDMDQVREKIREAISVDHVYLAKDSLKENLQQEFDFSDIIGNSKKILDLFEILMMVAPSDSTTLILGESGTGKELIADAIQRNSLRSNKPFITLNCAALPENLLESELFGHEKGAFTGATMRRQGRFELADQGTIFLDEIGDMSFATQAKILRVLQEGEFERLGGDKTLHVDVRVIAATNKNLEEEVQNGKFRQDLYFRLGVVPIEIPSLRERKKDIPLLAEYFLKKSSQKNQRLIKGFTPEAIDVLSRYSWPGNVRELENVVERAVILTKQEMITPEALPPVFRQFSDQEQDSSLEELVGHSLKEVEKELILKTLKETGNNITHTAEILGITRRGLQYKLRELGIK
jgi:two-component system response regulator HydG